MNYKEVQEALNNVFSYLDTIDLRSYLIAFKKKTVRDMMDKLREDFPYKDKYSDELFDVVTEEEFVDYLNEKYNTNIKETVIIRFYI